MNQRPMGPCADDEELLRVVDGQLSENDAARVRAHCAECVRCGRALAAVQELVADVRAPSADVDDAAMVAALLRRIDGESKSLVAPARRRARATVMAGAIVAAAAAAMFTLVPSRRSTVADGAFAARGGGSASPSLRKGTSVAFYAVAPPGQGGHVAPARPLTAGAIIGPDVGLAVAYRNARTAPTYLLAFAVDARGTVHWLEPAYESPGTDPGSVALVTVGGESMMASSVVFDAPAPGPMRLVSIVSSDVHHVSEIESLPPSGLSLEALRRRWPEASVDEMPLTFSVTGASLDSSLPH